MADDELAAELAAIGERARRVWNGRGNVGGLLAITEAKDDVPRLLAALEAALTTADGWNSGDASYSALEEDRVWARQACAGELRKAILSALTGKPLAGGDRS